MMRYANQHGCTRSTAMSSQPQPTVRSRRRISASQWMVAASLPLASMSVVAGRDSGLIAFSCVAIPAASLLLSLQSLIHTQPIRAAFALSFTRR